ncbi:MAG: hypothetical protein L0Y36_07195 [Planctomycetales bacterium]|nr:hypothetical protein [Planctomycetales bacterium]
MASLSKYAAIFLLFGFFTTAFCASVILNEYNAVDTTGFLGGGTLAADDSGGRASDSYFGRVMGNGGDWFELVVITDHLDMRGWMLDVYDSGVLDKTLSLTNHTIWSDLRSGTIITVAEDVPSDISYNPAGGDWWIHVQAKSGTDGLYIEAANFPVSSSNWQLRIKNAASAVIFGPAGEGVWPASGIGGSEIFRLEAAPSAVTAANSPDYDAGDNLSTFGSPNQWGLQNISQLRTVIPPASTLTLITPNGSEIIKGGDVFPITWGYTGTVSNVLIEFSADQGATWSGVYPPNAGNSGSYEWLVPMLDTDKALVRVTNTGNSGVLDVSNAVFFIYECPLAGDATGDCEIDLYDLAIMAASWLDCENPYDLNCAP